jgi:hypothetical protein
MANDSGRSWFRRAVSEGVDRLFLGNRAHDYGSGFWNARGAIQGGVEGIAGMALGPAGKLAARIGNNAYDSSRFTGVMPSGSLSGLVTNPGATANWQPNQYGQVGNMTPVVGGWASNGPAPGRGGLSNLIANPGANVDWTPNAQSDPWAGQQQQMAATMAAREAQGYGNGQQPAPNYRAAQDSFKSMRGDYASPNSFQSGSNASIFGGGGRYNF